MPSVFVSYSHHDEEWKDRIVQHLGVVANEFGIYVWEDRQIAPGQDWRLKIKAALDDAQVALLLVSADSLTSEFIRDEEVPSMLRRRASEGLRLIPVILKPCAWRDIGWLSSIQAYPRDGTPLSRLTEEYAVDDALAQLASRVARCFGPCRQAEVREIVPAPTRPHASPRGGDAKTSDPDAAPRDRAWPGVPRVTAWFAGREAELAALGEALAVPDRAVIAHSITGLGGVGKTQLAAQYVQTHGSKYDIVAWIRAGDGGVADLAELAGRLGEAVEGRTPSQCAELALERLGRSQGWLLVLDNVESAAQLSGCLPRSGVGRVLITSRNREVREFGRVLPVDVFDLETATNYLVARAGRPDDRHGARRLAEALGRLPLVLTFAAAYCEAGGTSFKKYLGWFESLRADELFDRPGADSHEQTVTSTWRLSIGAACKQEPLAAEVLAMASYLGPDAIPKALFSVLVDRDEARASKRITDAFNALARLSLITAADETITVHRVLQKVIRDATPTGEGAAVRHHTLRALDRDFPKNVTIPDRWPLCERLLPHVLAGSDHIAHAGGGGVTLIELLNRASLYVMWSRPGSSAVELTQTTRERAELILGEEHPETLRARNWAAFTLRQVGRVDEAITILEPLLADRNRILGAEHPDTLNTRSDLGVAYRDKGRVDEAIAIFEPLLAHYERILGAKPRTLNARSDLGLAYRDAGRIDEAIAIFDPLPADFERILGPKHPSSLVARGNRASVYRDAGRVDEAIAMFEPLLSDQERILNAEHTDTLRTRNNLAVAYQTAGRVDDAIAIYEPLVADYERLLGAEHRDTLRTCNNLAVAYQTAGRVDEAIGIYEPLIADCERILGAEHASTLITRVNLASAYQAAGRVDDAIATYTPLRADDERILRAEQPTTPRAHDDLARAYDVAQELRRILTG